MPGLVKDLCFQDLCFQDLCFQDLCFQRRRCSRRDSQTPPTAVTMIAPSQVRKAECCEFFDASTQKRSDAPDNKQEQCRDAQRSNRHEEGPAN
jgi:hypothetical protein